MKPLILTLALISSAVLGGVAGGNIIAYQQKTAPAFDYERCDAITADLASTNPGIPEHFKEIKRTPGGNWCITE